MTTCASCRTVGPSGAAWCPRCYLPYVRPDAGGTAVAGRHRTVIQPAAPAKSGSWSVRLFCMLLAVLVGCGLTWSVRRGLSCQASTLHPDVKVLDAAVQKDLSSIQTLATGTTSPGWTLQDGAKVVAADATLFKAVPRLTLSDPDRAAITSYVRVLRSFDTALSTYMTKDDDASHQAYGAAAVALQSAADKLSTTLAAVPKRCRLS